MKDTLEMAGGLVAGLLVGLLVGCALSWGQVSVAFHGWPTCWQDCGPFVFVPVWIGGVIGMASTLEHGSLTGLLITMCLGAAAGFFAALAFFYVFDKNLSFYFLSLKVPYIVNLTNAIAGGLAGAVWHFLYTRFFRSN